MTFKDISVESPKTDVEPHSLGSRSPKCFMLVETYISTVRQDRCRNYITIWIVQNTIAVKFVVCNCNGLRINGTDSRNYEQYQ